MRSSGYGYHVHQHRLIVVVFFSKVIKGVVTLCDDQQTAYNEKLRPGQSLIQNLVKKIS